MAAAHGCCYHRSQQAAFGVLVSRAGMLWQEGELSHYAERAAQPQSGSAAHFGTLSVNSAAVYRWRNDACVPCMQAICAYLRAENNYRSIHAFLYN